ncbi:MAG: His/Gly/Thr/Pro-type tRNA ligase C-terminal domain-containing protein [Patescibacteria group bacterium]|jgi:prolyl-tRNA synthetase|nr:His/Gly/Thr/Pro-type tRNA ligase C-terminal domain-containing protein [Patescibacteria group bacterium]
MRQSKNFIKATKDLPKDETSFNAQALIRAGFIDKLGAGIYTYLPYGLRVLKKISQIVREEMDKIGGQELLMPALNPKENWVQTNRWEGFDALFKLGNSSDSKEYALAPTHEEIVTPLVQKHVFSYKDLPVYPYHIQTKFRNEKRAKAGLIRGREFLMKDLYSFHVDNDDLNNFYLNAQKAYFKIFERCGLLENTYLTYASGGSFSKYSHEFQTVTEAGEDTIYICQDCSVAINSEIIEEQNACPNCGNEKLEEEKAVEVGNIFKLATKFSEPFGFQYVDEEGNKKPVIMGCYGIGPSRIMGTVVEVHHDEKGIVWPDELSPYRVHLIELKSDNKDVKKLAEGLYEELMNKDIEVLYDDRDFSAGAKFAEADLIGCTYRVVISEKNLKKNVFEFKKRDEEKAEMLEKEELIDKLLIS